MRIKRNLNVALAKALTSRWNEIEGEVGFSGNPIETILSVANTYNPDILVAPEFLFYDGKRIMTEDEKKSIEKIIANEVHRKDMLIIPGSIMWHNPKEGGLVKNTSPVITGGKVIAEHMKATDGGCENIARNHGLRYARGPKKGTIFSWNGLDIGLEICADHICACLLSTGKKVDFHIVPASGMSYCSWNNCSRGNGYFILCDGFEGCSNRLLQRKGAEDFKDVNCIKKAGNADIYRIEAEVEEGI
ncbi:MAG: hypothetical protein QME12_04360 [Nanoarchaeota archaeon]|nr:hypothetical protein [Nanoarchaeota archaeon]